jgi:hypothetical protein
VSLRRRAVSALLAVTLAGCSPTIVRSGVPAGASPAGYTARWHHGFVLGLVDATGSYDIARICPSGWSEIRAETTVGAGVLQLVTVGLYTPSSVTIVCAARSGDRHARGEEPLPR